MKMALSGIQIFMLILSLATDVLSLPYRSFSSRSVPGRIRVSEPDNIKDYLSKYLDMIRQQQLQSQQQPLQYGLPEYEPLYQQGYISRKPQISPETIAAILPYLSQSEFGDYAYDYSAIPSNSYNDDDGTWYDDAAGTPEFVSTVDSRDKNNQEAALLQLFLDHLAGKYSLEDLETLERQAAIEDNTENQLQALMPHKKSSLPLLGTHSTARNIIGYPETKGQKEEPLVVPASSVRKPVFARSSAVVQKWQDKSNEEVTASSPVVQTSKDDKDDSKNNQKTSNKDETQQLSTTTSTTSTTMEPSVKSAYEALMAYLDQERFLRKAADEAKHSPQKRFVSDTQSLTQQLAGLKKTVT